MSNDVFHRFALVAFCTLWALAIALVWRYIGWPTAVFAALGGIVGAVLLSVEVTPEKTALANGDPVPGGLAHREISRRARVAAGSDEDAA